jgi:hypothetical protein
VTVPALSQRLEKLKRKPLSGSPIHTVRLLKAYWPWFIRLKATINIKILNIIIINTSCSIEQDVASLYVAEEKFS